MGTGYPDSAGSGSPDDLAALLAAHGLRPLHREAAGHPDLPMSVLRAVPWAPDMMSRWERATLRSAQAAVAIADALLARARLAAAAGCDPAGIAEAVNALAAYLRDRLDWHARHAVLRATSTQDGGRR